MKRRSLIVLCCCTTAGWTSGADAQQRTMPVVGYLSNASSASFARFVSAFRLGMSEQGYVEGRNVAIEYRWADGHPDRLPALVDDLLRRRVAVIVATGGSAPAVAAKAATSTVPIVFTGGDDPVKLGLVASFGRPGGNATGIVNIATELTAKRLGLLRELAPASVSIGVLVNPTRPDSEIVLKEIHEAARAIGRQVHVVDASSEREFDAAFSRIVQGHSGALHVSADPLFTTQRARLVALAASHRIPASYPFREFVEAGGLMSYGPDLADIYRQAGVYAGRILKGVKPAELPVSQPIKFDLVINSSVAKALGIVIPPKLLVNAELIE